MFFRPYSYGGVAIIVSGDKQKEGGSKSNGILALKYCCYINLLKNFDEPTCK
jgi:hypothetical protein